jgi:hypothetical protein
MTVIYTLLVKTSPLLLYMTVTLIVIVDVYNSYLYSVEGDIVIDIADVHNSYLYFILGDRLSWHSGLKFSTRDQDNDAFPGHCAVHYHHGAWWFGDCARSNLNGQYGSIGELGPEYMSWKRGWEALKRTTMLIRAK